MRKIRAKLLDLALPLLARRYRKSPTLAPRWLLRAIGIADPSYRSDFYTLARILDSMPTFDGCIIECGVYRGSTLLGMAHRLALRRMSQVRLIGCDSFEGFPEPTREDAAGEGTFHRRTRKGTFGDVNHNHLMNKVRRLGYDDRIVLMKGFFDQTLPQLEDTRFTLAHLDCDLYRSYLVCLAHLYPRMVPDGIIVFDEYDFSAGVYPGAQKAIDEFLVGKPEKIQRFPEAANPRYFIRKK